MNLNFLHGLRRDDDLSLEDALEEIFVAAESVEVEKRLLCSSGTETVHIKGEEGISGRHLSMFYEEAWWIFEGMTGKIGATMAFIPNLGLRARQTPTSYSLFWAISRRARENYMTSWDSQKHAWVEHSSDSLPNDPIRRGRERERLNKALNVSRGR